MTFDEKIKTIERIDHLIRTKATGTPSQLSSKLDISERCLYDLLNIMKELKAPIRYCTERRSYLYTYEVTWSFGFERIEALQTF